MIIRPARPNDAPDIAAIAESVRFHRFTADPARGFLVYVGEPEDYAARIQLNPSNLVAEVDGAIAGFLFFTTDMANTATHADLPEVQSLVFGPDTTLIDQIGIAPEARGQGIAPALFARMRDSLQPRRLTAAIMHGPMRNERSIGFFAGRNGFRCAGEYQDGLGFLWGVYEWRADNNQGDERYPIGRFLYSGPSSQADFDARIERLEGVPEQLRAAAEALPAAVLDRPIRPGAWTARQIIHHVADGNTVMANRVRLILTESTPMVKTFDENLWVELEDARCAPIEESLLILSGVHARLGRLLRSRPLFDLSLTMRHPEQGIVKLDRLLSYLDWHGRHHTAQLRAPLS